MTTETETGTARRAFAPPSSGSPRGLIARVLSAAGTIAIVLFFTATTAGAHTVFDGSTPADGSVVAVSPGRVELNFTHDIDLGLTQVHLADATGRTVAGLVASIDPSRPTRLFVAVPPLTKQTYRLSFETRDPVDLHQTSSSTVFGVGTAPTLTAARPSLPGPDWSETMLRWLARAGLALALGALVIALLVLPKALVGLAVPPARRTPGTGVSGRSGLAALQAPLFGAALAGVAIAAAGDTGLLALQAGRIGPLSSSFGRVLSQSEFGRRWIVGLQIAVGSVLVLAWLRAKARAGISTEALRQKGRRGRFHPVVAAAVVMVSAQAVAVATSGHVTEVSRPKAVGVGLLSAHLLAVGAWMGALLALLGILVKVMRSHPGDRKATADLVRALLEAFSPVAATGLVVVVTSGLLLSGSQVATVTALLSSPYGAVLVAKVVVVAVAAAFGAYHFRRVRRRTSRRTTTTLMIEAALGAVLMLAGAAMATAAPALGPQYRPGAAATGASTLTTTSADLVVRVSLRPDRPGPNLLAADVLDTRRPAPAPIETVQVRLSGPGGAGQVITLSPTGNGHFDGGAVDLKPGPLTVDFSIVRPGEPVAAGRLPWTVNGPQPYRAPVVVSTARLAPITTAAAGFVVALALICFGISWWRRRHSRRPEPAPPGPAEPLPPGDSVIGGKIVSDQPPGQLVGVSQRNSVVPSV